MAKFDFEGARAEGYSDQEIASHLAKRHKNFDVEAAVKEGYSPEEVFEHLNKKSVPVKAGRLAMQAGLSVAERALLPYELAVAPLSSKEAQQVPYREELLSDIQQMQEQKAAGNWSEENQNLYDSLVEQIQNPEKADQFTQTADIGVRGLTKKATGIETAPEGALEKAVSWTAFIKNPANAKALIQAGSSPKAIMKAISPTGTEAMRGLGAGLALEMAEDERLGPIGSLAAAVVGDLAGSKAKGIGKAIISPKQTLAKGTAALSKMFSSAEKQAIQKEIIQDFRNAGLQADLGTITGNTLIQSAQARLAASGLTGEAFEKFKEQLTKDVVGKYKGLANELGEARFATTYEANELGKEMLTKLRDADRNVYRELYKDARKLAKGKTAVLQTPKLADKIATLEAEMAPGAVKSPSAKKVLDELETLKKDLYDAEGALKPASVEALVNDKINLGDIVDYDVQGGSKQLLKGIIKDIDNALIEYGGNDREFLKKYLGSNKRFATHAKTFRNENVNKILMSDDPTHLLKKMDTIKGIKDIRKAFQTTKEGKKFFDDLSRLKMDEIVEKNMLNGTTNQLNLGTFSNILDKGKNREVVRELMKPEAFKELVKLQKNVGKLYNSAQKFYNASSSATAAIDAKLLNNIVNLPVAAVGVLTGNYWAAAPYGIIAAMKVASKLMTDPKFLRAIEDALIAGETKNAKLLEKAIQNLAPYARELFGTAKENSV